jgi:hypothetical protein
MLLAQWIVGLAGAYLALGLVFALAFALRGCQRLDPAAATGTWGFRALIVPGAAALWPLLLRRWIAGPRQPPTERNAHRDAAGGRGA